MTTGGRLCRGIKGHHGIASPHSRKAIELKRTTHIEAYTDQTGHSRLGDRSGGRRWHFDWSTCRCQPSPWNIDETVVSMATGAAGSRMDLDHPVDHRAYGQTWWTTRSGGGECHGACLYFFTGKRVGLGRWFGDESASPGDYLQGLLRSETTCNS